MKKLTVKIIIVAFTLINCVGVFADTNTITLPYAVACIDNNALYFNGSICQQSAAPIIDDESGCMMLPIEWIKLIAKIDYEIENEAMNYDKYVFNRNTLELSVQLHNEFLEAVVYRGFYSNLDLARVDQAEQQDVESDGVMEIDWQGEFKLGASVRTINDTVYIPARKFLEILGYTVEWNEEINGVSIFEPDYDKLIETDFYYDPNVNFNKANRITGSMSYIIKNNGYLPVVKRSKDGQEYFWNICSVNGTNVVKDHNKYSVEQKHIVIAPHSTYNSSGGSGVSSEVYQRGYLPEGEYYENCRFTKKLDYSGIAIEIPLNKVYFSAPKPTTFSKTKTPEEEAECKRRITQIKASKPESMKTNQVILSLKEGADNSKIMELLAGFDFEYNKYLELTGSFVLEFHSVKEADQAVDVLNASNYVNYAEPNYLIEMY